MKELDEVWRAESGRVRATLIRLLRSFDLAEEALHDAFAAAAEGWPREGVPRNPRAWLVSAGRFKAIDRMRRNVRHAAAMRELTMEEAVEPEDAEAIADDTLRLIFTCCHPALSPDAQVAMTLREVCGLTTEAIARAFLVPAPTLAQRIVRAKTRIRDAGIPYEIPDADQLHPRLEAVLAAIYLVFNEGYSAHAGELADEAVRLGRLLVELLPEPDAVGLLALMLLHDSRRAARLAPDGTALLITEQDRASWDRSKIAEGAALVRTAMSGPEIGHYAIQSAIALEHTRDAVDWAEVVRLYGLLVAADPSPVVRLNQAVALGMRDGPEAALPLIDSLIESDLRSYYLAHAARADFCRRLGRKDEALTSYRRALELAGQEQDRRFLRKRISDLGT